MINNTRKNIVFITQKDYSHFPFKVHDYNLIIQDNFDDLTEFIYTNDKLGYDKEFNSLNVFKAKKLLAQFGRSEIQYVVDETSMDLKVLEPYMQETTLIGHNIKIDYKVDKLHNDITFRKVIDTMLSEQVIFKGSGYTNNLNDVTQRHLRINPLKKDVRETFWRMNPNTLFTINQVLYAAEDTEYAIPLEERQAQLIKQYHLEKDLYDIEFPYTTIVADAELAGFKLNEDGWRKVLNDNEKQALVYKNELNKILRDLCFHFPELKVLRIHREVKNLKTYQPSMFGYDPIIINPKSKSTVNYDSVDQVKNIFNILHLPLPKKMEGREEKDSVGIPALQKYQIDYPDHALYGFVDKFIKYKELTTLISSFGEKFLVEQFKREKGKQDTLGYKSNKTGKVYTIYKQCGTDTTRMASGDQGKRKDKNDPPPEIIYYNSQNIPKPKRYRNCFLADSDKYVICTLDLSGAELVIAASLSGDKKLIELIKSDDQHSPLADHSYNEIISYIRSNMSPSRQKMELEDLLKANAKLLNITEEEAKEVTKERVNIVLETGRFEINKKSAEDIRTKFKNVNYSMVYGGGIEKIMELLNICKTYAIIVERALRDYLPELFEYLDAASKFGVEKGYIRFNKRLGTRFWFKEVLQASRDNRKLPNWMKGEVERKCKNYPIQGTQGQMLKEATVRFYYDYVYPNNYDITPKLWVHDEHVCQFLKTKAEQHGKVMQKYFNDVSSSYLIEGLRMKSEYVILPYWTK